MYEEGARRKERQQQKAAELKKRRDEAAAAAAEAQRAAVAPPSSKQLSRKRSESVERLYRRGMKQIHDRKQLTRWRLVVWLHLSFLFQVKGGVGVDQKPWM